MVEPSRTRLLVQYLLLGMLAFSALAASVGLFPPSYPEVGPLPDPGAAGGGISEEPQPPPDPPAHPPPDPQPSLPPQPDPAPPPDPPPTPPEPEPVPPDREPLPPEP